jgi:anti-anti-sigma factor
MGFEIQTRAIGRVVVIEAAGRFTTTDGHTKLRDLIHVLTESGTKKFVLRSGIGELLRSHFVVRQSAGELKLACVRARVIDILKISRMHTIFEVHPTEDEALRAFGQTIG